MHFTSLFHLYCPELFIREVDCQWGTIGDGVTSKKVYKRISFDGFLGYILNIVLLEQYHPSVNLAFRFGRLRMLKGPSFEINFVK